MVMMVVVLCVREVEVGWLWWRPPSPSKREEERERSLLPTEFILTENNVLHMGI